MSIELTANPERGSVFCLKVLNLSDLRNEASHLKRMALEMKRKTARVLYRIRRPIAPAEMRASLNQLIGSGTEILFVHTSLSRCGYFTAGPSDVLLGLSEFCDTLAFPTHTYCYPPLLGEPGPLFDPQTTPSKTGLLTELFRKQTSARRSIHATHSLAASGTLVREICDNHHRQDTPCGTGTPYSRLVQRRAAVLLFGVRFDTYTFFHTAEDSSNSEFAYEQGVLDRLRVIDENREEQECRSRRQSLAPRRFADAGELIESAGLARRVPLGGGFLIYVPDSLQVHEFLLERLRKVPDFLYQSCPRSLQ
jgi:aminoglycoside 3-N-acetyltransferase